MSDSLSPKILFLVPFPFCEFNPHLPFEFLIFYKNITSLPNYCMLTLKTRSLTVDVPTDMTCITFRVMENVMHAGMMESFGGWT